jgi:hypothetical protein
MYFCLLSLLSLFTYSLGTICTPPQGTYYIETQSQLAQLKNCSTINGNLRIIGEYDIYNLYDLENITDINGHLMIIDSHSLNSLSGLNNLQQIHGNNLYLDTYSVVIRNNNFIDQNYTGLCYVNNINWSLLTNHSVLLNNNNDNCSCNLECNGCWNDGPNNCQICNNFKSGNFCVDTCEYTLINNTNQCLESIPGNVNLSYYNLNQTSLMLNWSDPYPLNGVIEGYQILLNNNLVYNQQVTYDNVLLNNYSIINNLSPETDYNITFMSNNNIYSSNPQYLDVYFNGTSLEGNLEINNYNIYQNNIDVSWNLNGLFGYNLTFIYEINNIEDNTTNQYLTVNNLEYNTEYTFQVKVCQDSQCSNITYLNFTTGYEPILNPVIDYTFINQTYLFLNWTDISNANYQYYLTIQEQVIHQNNLNENYLILNDLVPNTEYIFHLRSFNQYQDNNTYILTNLNTLDYLELLPPEIITTNYNYVSLYLEPYFYNYPMYENTLTQLMIENINSSEIFQIYNAPFMSNITIQDSRIMSDNVYKIKRLIKHNSDVLRESNYSELFSVSLPETTTSSNILPTIPINNNDHDHTNDDNRDVWIIVGIIIASVAILILVAYILVTKRNRDLNNSRLSRMNPDINTQTYPNQAYIHPSNDEQLYNGEYITTVSDIVDTTSLRYINPPPLVPKNMMNN